MDINLNAPLVARHSVSIAAPAATVWALLTSIDGWPRWHTAITRATLDGPLAVGSVFRWTSGGTAIVSTIQLFEAGQRFGWSGRALGTTTEHIWTIESSGESTVVTTAESMSGWLIRLLKLFAPSFLDDALTTWLAALKRAAEATPQAR
jgi:uncharacterized protein YndB with AHSA1/START domain